MPAVPTTDRRSLLATAATAATALALGARTASAAPAVARRGAFQLDYAPHFGMFRHHAGDDPLDQIQFMADEGFGSIEDNGMSGRSVDLQEKIGAKLAQLGMRMGVFVANKNGFKKGSFASGKEDERKSFLADLENSVKVAERTGATWCTVVLGGLDPRLEIEYQTANVVETLRRGVEICEPAGLVMVLEPLNPWTNHPGLYLTRMPQAFLICRSVDSPSCKILDDLYHQQITEGNLIPNMDRSWNEIGYFQIGDNPGRNEPGTGEINYRNVFRHIHAKGFTGILGMEHGNSRGGKEGERAVIDAYRTADAF